MTSYLRQIGNVLYKLAFLLILYSFSRILFYTINIQAFNGSSFFELLKVFVCGVRFDFTVVVYYNLLFIVLYLLPFNFVHNKYYKRVVGISFYTVNFFLLLLNFTDCEYFKFTGKRSTADIFGYVTMNNDALMLLPRFLKDFWYLVVCFGVVVAGGIYAMGKVPFPKIEHHRFGILSWIGSGVLFLLLVGVLFAGARGLGLKPIRILTASQYTSSQNIPLILNTPFTILMTVGKESVKPIVYYSNSQLAGIYTPEQGFPLAKPKRVDNVVIIILESFSKEFIGFLNGGKGYTPCFDSIMRQGLVFENAFANGKRSIEAVPAIFAGLPAFTDDSYISSRFSGNRIVALPSILAQNGYHTSFFHGGRNGTMDFDAFCKIAGIQHYYGLNEYVGPKAFDGNWGIFDEEFLQYYAGQLNNLPKPMFSAVFTLSSHHPYTIPEKYKNMFLDTPNEVVRSVRYADFALGKFFQTISKSPWYKNTLFVFSADHTSKQQSEIYGSKAGIYRIPIVYFHPGDSSIHGISKRVTQQADIMPSLMDYLGIKTPFLAFGSSVFDPGNQGYAVNFLGGIYQYFQGDWMLCFDGEKTIGLYDISKDPLLRNNLLSSAGAIASPLEARLKAMIQQYNYRLLNNKMVTGIDR